MPYFTSWDINVFLCLLSWGIPEDVVKRMINMTKKIHEDHTQKESLKHWSESGANAYEWFRNKKDITQEFKEIWKWRCPEKRRENVVQWTRSSWDWNCKHIWSQEPYFSKGEGTSRAGYWNSGEAWSYYLSDCSIDTSGWDCEEEEQYFEMKERQRRLYVSQWYKGIHEGRYFLFFKENDLSSDWDKYRYAQHPYVGCISDMSHRWQVAQDLLTIDGPGIGEKSREKVEHIDDMFLKV